MIHFGTSASKGCCTLSAPASKWAVKADRAAGSRVSVTDFMSKLNPKTCQFSMWRRQFLRQGRAKRHHLATKIKQQLKWRTKRESPMQALEGDCHMYKWHTCFIIIHLNLSVIDYRIIVYFCKLARKDFFFIDPFLKHLLFQCSLINFARSQLENKTPHEYIYIYIWHILGVQPLRKCQWFVHYTYTISYTTTSNWPNFDSKTRSRYLDTHPGLEGP